MLNLLLYRWDGGNGVEIRQQKPDGEGGSGGWDEAREDMSCHPQMHHLLSL